MNSYSLVENFKLSEELCTKNLDIYKAEIDSQRELKDICDRLTSNPNSSILNFTNASIFYRMLLFVNHYHHDSTYGPILSGCISYEDIIKINKNSLYKAFASIIETAITSKDAAAFTLNTVGNRLLFILYLNTYLFKNHSKLNLGSVIQLFKNSKVNENIIEFIKQYYDSFKNKSIEERIDFFKDKEKMVTLLNDIINKVHEIDKKKTIKTSNKKDSNNKKTDKKTDKKMDKKTIGLIVGGVILFLLFLGGCILYYYKFHKRKQDIKFKL